MGGKSRRFCFTLNGYKWDEDPTGERMLSEPLDKKVEFVIWSKEQAPSTGTMHIQGYMRLKNQGTIGTVQKVLGYKCHVEACDGSEGDNVSYCSKENTHIAGPWELGKRMVGKGYRTDLVELAAKVQRGELMERTDPEDGAQFLRFASSIGKLRSEIDSMNLVMRDRVDVLVICGPTGIGKSKWVWDLVESVGMKVFKLHYPTPGGVFWFPGYTGQETLFLDEFTGEQMSPQAFNELVDEHPYRLRTNTDTFVWAKWTRVIVNCNLHPSTWYPKATPVVKAAVLRRCGDVHIVRTREDLRALWKECGGPPHPRWSD